MQNRCPYQHINEDPGWIEDLIMAFNAYQNGVLPHAGGMSEQPALFMPIMSTIQSALDAERDYEKGKKDEERKIAEAHRAAAEGGPYSVLHGPKPGSVPIKVPGRPH